MKREKRKAVYQKTGGRCIYCGRILDTNNWQLEHFLSRSNGGNDDLGNLFPACKRCNVAKKDRSLEEFRKRIISLSIRGLGVIRNRLISFDMQPGSTHTTEEILYKIKDLECALSGCTVKLFIDDNGIDKEINNAHQTDD